MAGQRCARNLRQSLRVLRKNPRLTLTILATLVLGIGANTAIFTLDYATLLAPLPYPDPRQLVMVWSVAGGHRGGVSPGDLMDWKRRNTVFEDLNAWSPDDFNIATPDRPEFIEGMLASPGYNAMLGTPLLLGRNFVPEEGEPGNDHAVILSNRLWKRLGANRDIIGGKMQVNGQPYSVVGVLEPGVADRKEEELMVPLVFTREQQTDHASREWYVTGRLEPGVTIQQAQIEMNRITAEEAREFPATNRNWIAAVEPLKNDFLAPDRRRTLWVLLGAVGFLLLIACINVAGLLLAHGVSRYREVAIRVALGASRAAIFSQFLTENLALAICGGILGVAAGYAILRAFITLIPSRVLTPEADPRLNIPVLLAMLAVALFAGVVFGCAPAWHAARIDPAGILKSGGRAGIHPRRQRLRRILVIAEFALALPMLAGAGLMIRTFWNLTHVDSGIRADHVLAFYLDTPRLSKDPKQTVSYYQRMLAVIQAVPGVSAACAMSYLPFDDLHARVPFAIAGQSGYAQPSQRPRADLQMVSPGYFGALGIQILRGRAFTAADAGSAAKVAIVNQAFVDAFLRGRDPLRQTVLMKQEGEPGPDVKGEWRIVGVVRTLKSRGMRKDQPEIDTPFWQSGYPDSGIAVRTVGDPLKAIRGIGGAVNAIDPQAALYNPRTLTQIRDEALGADRLTAILLASFAALGLLLAATGIHGVMSLSVAQRSNEMALRMALGASRRVIMMTVLKEGAVLTCAGSALGLLGSAITARSIQSLLFGVNGIDWITFSAVALVLSVAALLACGAPAVRGSNVDIVEALKAE